MSHYLDQLANHDAQRAADLARSDAELLASMFPLCRATGNHLVAQNDEPELTEADFIAADLLERIGKAERRFGLSYRCAVEDQVQRLRNEGAL